MEDYPEIFPLIMERGAMLKWACQQLWHRFIFMYLVIFFHGFFWSSSICQEFFLYLNIVCCPVLPKLFLLPLSSMSDIFWLPLQNHSQPFYLMLSAGRITWMNNFDFQNLRSLGSHSRRVEGGWGVRVFISLAPFLSDQFGLPVFLHWKSLFFPRYPSL